MKNARIVIADDHPLILDGLRNLLEPQYDILEMVVDGKSLVEAVLRCRPTLVVTDITMPVLNGIEAARLIRQVLPEVKLLFVTMHATPAYLKAVLELGDCGYVLKSAAGNEVLTAAEQVLQGQVYVSPGMGGHGGRNSQNPVLGQAQKSLRLTERERQILQLIAEGRTSKETAQILNVADKTVSFHRDNMRNKLGLRSIAELTKYAIEEGII